MLTVGDRRNKENRWTTISKQQSTQRTVSKQSTVSDTRTQHLHQSCKLSDSLEGSGEDGRKRMAGAHLAESPIKRETTSGQRCQVWCVDLILPVKRQLRAPGNMQRIKEVQGGRAGYSDVTQQPANRRNCRCTYRSSTTMSKTFGPALTTDARQKAMAATATTPWLQSSSMARVAEVQGIPSIPSG